MQYHQIQGTRSPEDLMRTNLIVKHLAGSKAYGTALPTSDTDIRGLFIGDRINIATPWYTIKEGEIGDSEDAKLYEFHHFMKLYVDQNPNIMETLWVHEDDLLHVSQVYCHLRNHRWDLMSKKIAHTYTGYAMAQLKRIRGHNKWINNPQPVEPPQQVDFVKLIQWFGETRMMPRDFTLRKFSEADWRLVPYGGNIFGLHGYDRNLAAGFTTLGHTPFNLETGALNTQFEGERHELGTPAAIVKFNEKEYKLAKENHEHYWSWKKNRNAARSTLEEQFGYDTKHAMHLVRLMRTGHEALTTGEIQVRRPDANELLDIRAGSWSYDDLMEFATEMDHQVRDVDYKTTDLPRSVDLKFAANLVLDIQEMMWSSNQ